MSHLCLDSLCWIIIAYKCNIQQIHLGRMYKAPSGIVHRGQLQRERPDGIVDGDILKTALGFGKARGDVPGATSAAASSAVSTSEAGLHPGLQ